MGARVEAAYTQHAQEIYRYALSIVGNRADAEDVLQTVMGKALTAAPADHGEAGLRPWLYRVAHNEAISSIRRNSRQADQAIEADEQAASGAASPAASLESKGRIRTLVADLQQLPERQRASLVLREMSGLSYEEIATSLECSEAAARQSVYEARTALHARAEGRAMACDQVRRVISDGDRRRLRSKQIRAHLGTCEGCKDFQAAIETRSDDLQALFPPLPAAALGGALAAAIGSGGGASSGAVGAATGGGVAAAGAGGLGGAVATKAAVVATVAAIGLGGGEASGVVELRGADQPAAGASETEPSAAEAGGESSQPADGSPEAGSAGEIQADGRRGNERAVEARRVGVRRSRAKGANRNPRARSAKAGGSRRGAKGNPGHGGGNGASPDPGSRGNGGRSGGAAQPFGPGGPNGAGGPPPTKPVPPPAPGPGPGPAGPPPGANANPFSKPNPDRPPTASPRSGSGAGGGPSAAPGKP